ncbi:YceG-like family [Lysinibacillus sphaericus]|nr:YceG-like family [Lysinibacillus sphaericus]
MIRQLLQLIGVGCLTAGAVLFFTSGTISSEDKDSVNQDKAIAELNQELATVKAALADAQKATKADDKTTVSTQKSDESEKKDSVIKMILTLSSGDTSKDASDSLEKSGIIKSATEFEGYLTKNGLSGKMQIGQHEVDSSMSFADLAKELTTVKH